MAGARPVFDFTGSLELARTMWAFGESLAGSAATRAGSRNTALNAWQGVYGDEYRERAATEDQSELNIRSNIGNEAVGISLVWATAVSLMNGTLYAEAIDDQRAYLEREIAAAERRREQEQNWFMELGNDIGDWFGGSAWSGSKDPYDYVEVPRSFDAPALPAFSPPGGFLASYRRSGHYLNITYISSVPA